MGQLKAWHDSPRRKPLLLEGPRQVGKTWLLKELGRQAYETTAYLDFEQTPSLRAIFDGDFDAASVISRLQIATGVPIKPGSTLIVLDEIQACPAALTALKYLGELAGEYHVAGAGSLLGVALHQDYSFPVGRVNFAQVYPLSFVEFLRANGQVPLAQALAGQDWKILAPFHDRLVGHLRDYLFVGGMPEAVAVFAARHDFALAREVQLEILQAYDRDFSKHAPPNQVPRLRAVWQSIPHQLAREQRRFSYQEIGPGARSRTHLAAIEWLVQAGVVMAIKRVKTPKLPLSGYTDPAAFKLYLADVGLLGALAGLNLSTVLEPGGLFTEFRGSLTEQYAAMELRAALGQALHYWSSSSGTAEVDFVVELSHDVVPIEVKANRNLKARSLRVYRDKYAPGLAVRSSLAPYGQRGLLVDLPLYGLMGLKSLAAGLASI